MYIKKILTLLTNAISDKNIQNSFTFLKKGSSQNIEMRDISFTEEEIEKNFGNLNEYAVAGLTVTPKLQNS